MENHLAYSELSRRRLNKEDYDDFNSYKAAKADELLQRENFRKLKMFFYYMVLIVCGLGIFFYHYTKR